MTPAYVNPLAAREPELPRGAVSEGGLVHPRAEEALTFDECEEAGVDGTGRFV